ncbi:MAG: hypothetical protein ABI728_07420 [Betaproteobacteria bacterium]
MRARWRAALRAALELAQGKLFEPDVPGATVAVKLDRVRLEHSRSFGAVWLGWILWQALKLDELCGVLMPRARARVAWGEVIARCW